MNPAAKVAASVRQRLKNLADREGRPFADVLQQYALERFLCRLARSEHAGRFILKGALMLRVWGSPALRPTLDIDLLGRTENSESNIRSQMREILDVNVEPDGVVFDPDSIELERMAADAEYPGLRARFKGRLDSAAVHMQVDIGFGDVVHPEPETGEFPTALGAPAPRILCYSRESAIAEKMEAMVRFGELNSRMKDFYDIWLLARHFDFERAVLTEAVRLTFKNREREMPRRIAALEAGFVKDKQGQWTAFRQRTRLADIPASFTDIVSALEFFLAPVVADIVTGKKMFSTWSPARQAWS